MREEQDPKSVSLLDVIKSVASSFFGVQSTENRERDFRHGKPWQFIVVGLMLTGLFLLLVWIAVMTILKFATG